MDGAIDGRAGRCQYPHHLERQVVVLAERGVAGAVGDDDGLVQFVAQLLCHLGAEHRLERRVERPPLAQLQRLLLAVLQMGEVVAVGAEHPEPLVGVTEGEGDGPGDAWLCLDGLVGVPAHVVGGVADAKHRVEQQVHLTGAGADDEIGTRNGIGEALARLAAHPLHPEQQGDADGDGQQGKSGGEATGPEALQGEFQHMHLQPRGKRRSWLPGMAGQRLLSAVFIMRPSG
ncbi:hypothetical protein D3C84_563790 [compost metagenome]